ncbi:transcriptional coactivator p15/PC4 family protein [Candidatus Omnitrophota bacterium]
MLIGKFEKSPTEEVRGQIRNYKGRDRIDIRVWVDSKDGKERIPIPKGISLPIELMPEFKKLILDFDKAVESLGKNGTE